MSAFPPVEESPHYWIGAFRATLGIIALEGDEHSSDLAKRSLGWYAEGPLGDNDKHSVKGPAVWEADARSTSLPDVGGLTLGDARIDYLREVGEL